MTARETRIAVVGMSGLFPGALTTIDFWRDVIEGRDRITEIPRTHWVPDDYFDARPGTPDKVYAKRGGFLGPIEFSPMEFGLPPSALPATDTAQLLALLVAKRALQEATRGRLESIDRTRISVVLGVASATELAAHMAGRLQIPVVERSLRAAGVDDAAVARVRAVLEASYVPWQENTFPGLLGNVVAGRVANRLDLGGTNAVVDAACASSLAAVDMAVNELALGRSDLVVTGGVDTQNDILMFMCFAQTGALSLTGDCRPFSADADGTLLGEGLGMLALRRLEDAERDGDAIYAVIRGIGASSDGRGKSIYAPMPKGQALALRRAYEQAGYGPETVGLVEAHGTATKAGDAAEVESLRTVWSEAGAATQSCALGSIKAQIGHTKATAGAAGLMKVVLALHHKTLPPTTKVKTPSPTLGIESSAFYLNTKLRPWVHHAKHPRRGSVSALGFGGTNFHVAVEEYVGPAPRPARIRPVPAELVLLGASDPKALARACRDLAPQAGKNGALVHIAKKTQLAFDPKSSARLAVLATDEADLATKLRAAADALDKGEGELLPRPLAVHFSMRRASPNGDVAFLFPGQGSQYVGMTSDVAVHFDDARAVWDRAAEGVAEHVFPVPAFTDEARAAQDAALVATEWAQPGIAAASLSLLGVVARLGLKAGCTGGHSLGEITALAAAGAFDDETAIRIARARGELMAEVSAKTSGAMTAVMSDRGTVDRLLATWGIEVTVANDNAPRQVVLSGATAAIEDVERRLQAEKITCRRLTVSTAFHSPIVGDAVASFRAFLDTVDVRAPRVPAYANATASPYGADANAVRDALASAIARPVRFREQIEAMYAAGVRTFVEIGPEIVLSRLVERCLEHHPHVAVAIDQRGKHGVTALWDALGRLAVAGVALDFAALWDGVRLPDDPTARVAPKLAVDLLGANYGKPAHPVVAPATPARAPASEAAVAASKTAVPATPQISLPTAPVAAPARGAATSAATLEALRELQAPVIAAQREYQRLMAESHIAFLQAAASSMARLTGGAPLVLPSVASASPAASIAVPAAAALPPPNVAPDPQPARSEPTDILVPTVLAVVAEKTGYPAEMIGLSMDLEADLGIDSIKRVEILAAVRDRIPNLPDVDAARMASLRTLAEIAAVFGAKGASANGASHPRTVTVIEDAPPAPPSSDALLPLVLAVVAEKTGYPAEMIELTMDLEADLGIDSIKRVEILSAVRERAPNLPELDASRLAKLRSLADIVAFLANSSAPVPTAKKNGASHSHAHAPVAARSAPKRAADVRRFAVRAVPAPATGFALPGLLGAGEVVVVGDGSPLADAVVARLRARDVNAVVAASSPADASAVIFLRGLARVASRDEALAIDRAAFRLARTLAPRFSTHGGTLVTVQDTGGDFGLSGRDADRAWLGGIAAVAKTAAREWPRAFVRAIDLEAGGRSDDAIAAALVAELLSGGTELEVGLDASGARVAIDAVGAMAPASGGHTLPQGAFVVASGGARGVTAESLVRLAFASRPKLLLLGRAALEDEPSAYADAQDDASLKRVALEEAKREGAPITPRAVAQRVDAIAAAREIRRTLARLGEAGSEARYVAVDVRDRVALERALDEARSAWGPVRGLVHGAGVLSDSLLEKKTDEQFDRVFDTKVLGLAALLDATARDPLGWICVFSSVAARAGNRGQADYAMANDVLNKVAAAESRRRRADCRVVSIGWGPWQGGMVTPAHERLFAERGVALIPTAAGGDAFVRELACGGDVELVIAAGEAALGGERRKIEADVLVDQRTYPQLASHRVEGKVVLPAVLPVEWFVRLAGPLLGAASRAELEVRDLRVLRGVLLGGYGGAGDRFRVVGELSPDGKSASFELRDDAGAKRYVATVERAPASRRPRPDASAATPRPWTPPELYGPGALFHGPHFQMIRSVEGRDDASAYARLATATEIGWPDDTWHTNPASMDGAIQLAILVGLHAGLGPTLPMRIGRIGWVTRTGEGPLACDATIRDRSKERIVCDLSLHEADGTFVADIDGLELYALPRGAA